MLNRIKNIIEVKPFAIKCEWTNGEIRLIDFQLLKKELGNEVLFNKILQPEIFKQVKLDASSKTLYWDNMMPYTDYDGSKKIGPLDFCPDVLYQQSQLVA